MFPKWGMPFAFGDLGYWNDCGFELSIEVRNWGLFEIPKLRIAKLPFWNHPPVVRKEEILPGIRVLSTIKSGSAYLCLNCEVVTNSPTRCVVCGNRQMWPIENWIGRVGHESYTQERTNRNTTISSPKLIKIIDEFEVWQNRAGDWWNRIF